MSTGCEGRRFDLLLGSVFDRVNAPGSTLVAKENPSSAQPVIPPIISLTGWPSRAKRNAALLAPLQRGPAQ